MRRTVVANTQFTPRQVLEAGRRAEEDGQRDYAVQFYQHVLSNNPSASEAMEAADAIRRIEGGDAANGRARAPAYPAAVSPPQQMPQQMPPMPQPIAMRTLQPQGYQTSPATVPSRSAQNGAGPYQPALPQPTIDVHPGPPTQRPNRNGHEVAVQHKAGRKQKGRSRTDGVDGAAVRHDDDRTAGPANGRKTYRFGRFLASLLGLLGLIGAIAGLVSLGANLLLWSTRIQNSLLSLLASSPLVAIVLLAGACVLILLSQMAKATFDAASHRYEHTSISDT